MKIFSIAISNRSKYANSAIYARYDYNICKNTIATLNLIQIPTCIYIGLTLILRIRRIATLAVSPSYRSSVCIVRPLRGREAYIGTFSENLVTRRFQRVATYRWSEREKSGEIKEGKDSDNDRDGNTNDNRKGNSIRIGKDRTVAPKRFHYRNRG